jgi:hypothetical protein
MFVGIRTEYATVARFGAQNRTAAGAGIEHLSGVFGHFFFLSESTLWTADVSNKVDHADLIIDGFP